MAIWRMRHSKFPKGCIEDTVDIYESFYSIPEKYIYPSFLLFSDPALGRCYRCMVIYEKHFNVLQYKESKLRLFGHLGQVNRCVLTTSMSTWQMQMSKVNIVLYFSGYCEENIESMDSLCNTITGDAPLYTMFRKDGDLVKCPFRGPHSFSYSKGDSGQVCKYPPSFMDTCSDNKRLQLRYQACMDVEGSEIASKEKT